MIHNALEEISETYDRTNVTLNAAINVVTNGKNSSSFKIGWQCVS